MSALHKTVMKIFFNSFIQYNITDGGVLGHAGVVGGGGEHGRVVVDVTDGHLHATRRVEAAVRGLAQTFITITTSS